MKILPDLDSEGALVRYGSQIRRSLDTDKDGKADKFDVILDGFGIQDSHLMPYQMGDPWQFPHPPGCLSAAAAGKAACGRSGRCAGCRCQITPFPNAR